MKRAMIQLEAFEIRGTLFALSSFLDLRASELSEIRHTADFSVIY